MLNFERSAGGSSESCERFSGMLMGEGFFDGGVFDGILNFSNLADFFKLQFLSTKKFFARWSNPNANKASSYVQKSFSFDTPSSQNKILFALLRREKSRDESKSWIFTITVCNMCAVGNFPSVFFSGVAFLSLPFSLSTFISEKISPNYVSCQSVPTYAHHVITPDDFLLSYCTILFLFLCTSGLRKMYVKRSVFAIFFHVFFSVGCLWKHRKTQTTFFLCVLSKFQFLNVYCIKKPTELQYSLINFQNKNWFLFVFAFLLRAAFFWNFHFSLNS